MEAARLKPADVGMIAAHATGTPDNDAAEYGALSRVMRESIGAVPVVAFKSHLGHTLGAAGAVELILSAKSMSEQIVPPCANVRGEDVEFAPLNLAVGSRPDAKINATLNTSLGFGGANTCVVLGKSFDNTPSYPRSDMTESPLVPSRILDVPAPGIRKGASGERASFADRRRLGGSLALPSGKVETTGREVFITGIGTLFPGLIGNDAFIARLTGTGDPVRSDAGAVDESQFASLLNARRVRRMSEYVKLSLAATMLCLRDAGIDDFGPFAERCAAILGTAHGSTNYCEQYYGQIVREGIPAANPMLFAEGVPNAAAAHLSLMLGIKGPCQTVIGTRTAGFDAIGLAMARIASGEWDRAIVGAADEYSHAINRAYGQWGLYGSQGFVTGAGAVSLLLESREAMEQRNGRARGKLVAAANGIAHGGGMIRLARSVFERMGCPKALIGSSNNTWIDRVEASVLPRADRSSASSVYGFVAESFSATPLAALSSVLLRGQLPGQAERLNGSRVGAITTDYAGTVSGVTVELV
jgi:3-oxoacyl-[acyl-carrier-protein] synthase II